VVRRRPRGNSIKKGARTKTQSEGAAPGGKRFSRWMGCPKRAENNGREGSVREDFWEKNWEGEGIASTLGLTLGKLCGTCEKKKHADMHRGDLDQRLREAVMPPDVAQGLLRDHGP